MDNTILKITFKENLSYNSIEMIKDILKNSLGFETEIYELEPTSNETQEERAERFDNGLISENEKEEYLLFKQQEQQADKNISNIFSTKNLKQLEKEGIF